MYVINVLRFVKILSSIAIVYMILGIYWQSTYVPTPLVWGKNCVCMLIMRLQNVHHPTVVISRPCVE